MSNFNENTRVQVPAALHLCRLGYAYLSEIEEYDHRTNIITPIFKESVKKLNPSMTDLEISQLLEPDHKEYNGTLKKFDFVVSNPPFKLDFPEYRDTLAADGIRFWAGVPNAVKQIGPKPKMAIYTCFIQHVLNSLSSKGKGAIVVPTGFITAKSGVESKILHKIVDEKWVYGCISMPSNVFADTGTNVSVVFFDKSTTSDKVILVDASKLGEDYQDVNNNKKHRLLPEEVELIVKTFRGKASVDGLSVAVTYDEIKEKGYSLSAGQYFDIKIESVDIAVEEFAERMNGFRSRLTELFAENHRLESEILQQLDTLKFNS